MQTLSRIMALIVASMMVISFAACSPDTSDEISAVTTQSTVPGGSVELALLSRNDAAPVNATPAPSGFVPGDSLPPVTESAQPGADLAVEGAALYQELTWEQLVPPGYRPEDMMAKYQGQLSVLADGDPAAMEIYNQMMEEFNNAPINEELNQINIRMPGFIAPLEYSDGLITSFLLVPYFGACIHVPPPPVNQTIHVTLAEGNGIIPGDSYYPFWVQGKMLAQAAETDIGSAGYLIEDAVVELYTYASP